MCKTGEKRERSLHRRIEVLTLIHVSTCTLTLGSLVMHVHARSLKHREQPQA
eukprot:m.37527 g.37527  ORF g.37527 m.37527 type:complete len:52 (+) comp10106_c0_seq1:494-649(+)